MAITEESRYEVYKAFKASHGDKVANTLIEMLPPVGWADVATKHDLDTGLAGLEEHMELRFSEFEERMDLRFRLIEKEFALVRAEFGERFDTIEAKFGERLERELRAQSTKFVVWLFAGLSLFSVVERLI